jgi:hypothetical protein
MNERFDPFQLLRELNPVSGADVRGEASSEHAQETLERILREERPPTRRSPQYGRRRPRWRRSYVLVLVALAIGVATAAWALTRTPTKTLTVGCYATLDLQARTVVVPTDDRSATAACREIWQRGDFGSAKVPELEACVLPSGAIGVFPSPTGRACEKLRLAPVAPETPAPPPARTTPKPKPPSPQATARTLKNKLVDAFLAKPCMDEQEATELVRAELRKLRVNDWGVRTNGPFSAARPCASLAFDEEHRTVLLVPMPRSS